MKRIYIAFFTLIAATLCACSTTPSESAPAASPVSSPTATVTAMSTAEMEKMIIDLEKKSWELYKNKQAKEFRGLLVPGYRTIYRDAIKDTDENLKEMEITDIKSYSLADIKVNFPVKDTAILTYKLTYDSSFKGKPAGGIFYSSVVWVNINGQWKSALYTETKAEPQPKK